MKNYFISALAVALPAISAFAIEPVVEHIQAHPTAKMTLSRSAKVSMKKATTDNDNAFFEGFEGRPYGYGQAYDEWLPDGWQDLSRSGETPPGYGEYRHNLTWRVLDNDNRATAPTIQNYAYEGECFAFIMADVAYEDKNELKEQDEWLITPTVTPRQEDWLYFKLFYRPSWTMVKYDRTDGKFEHSFDARNNQLEVYVSEDDGANWTKLWNVIDDEIMVKYTVEQLEEDLLDVHKLKYDPIYVNLANYVGKPIKIAFRYFGSHGHPMAIDNVAVGIPTPKASYVIPNGFMKQGISRQIEYPATPTLLIPYDYEATWVNTSEDILTNEWTYADATGAIVTSTATDLTTPAYEALKTYATPKLTGFFESRASEPYQAGYATMQAGGILRGVDTEGNEGEFGVGYYDITDPNHRIVMSSEYIGYNPDIDLAWEKILGQLDGAIDVIGFGNYYIKSEVPYGFDFVDIAAYIKEPISHDTNLELGVFALDEDGAIEKLIGLTYLNGANVPYSASNYVNLHFDFPNPVYASTDIFVVIAGFSRETDNIVFPYVKTKTEENVGNSFIYMNAWDTEAGEWYDTLHNLNSFPLDDGYHFAGLLMNIGASYSWMQLEGDNYMEVSADGGSKEFKIKAYHTPDRWAVSEDGVTACDWTSFTTTYDAASETYTMTLNVAENEESEARDTDLTVSSPGSFVTIHVKQAGGEGGVSDITTDSKQVKVSAVNGDIVVEGAASGLAEVYNVAGTLVASAHLDGRTVIEAAHLPKGVYMVNVNGNTTCKIVK